MKIILCAMLLSCSNSVSALDCGIPDPEAEWGKSDKIYIGQAYKGNYTYEKGVGFIEFTFYVRKTFKGKVKKREKAIVYKDHHNIGLGDNYIVFEKRNLIDPCGPTTLFELNWLKPENWDRADLPQKLIQKVLKSSE